MTMENPWLSRGYSAEYLRGKLWEAANLSAPEADIARIKVALQAVSTPVTTTTTIVGISRTPKGIT